MEKKEFKPVSLDQVQIGDYIFLNDSDDAIPFVVLDKGKPFILIENTITHYAHLYRPVSNLYKLV